ncbi:gliding motility-associated protein GldE [Apibacter sp. HY039]|uniref:gliding motility-associated protein GldE n=1 Tax=Apibacter sp. HY039 TaxID=2501476 RepID=UPI000FEC1AF5|nr:gliding motility-associated protein GldE [Apibacter sp. HY039]
MDDPEPTSLLLTIFPQIPAQLYIITGILFLLLFLIFISAGSEIAFLSLSQKELEKYKAEFSAQVDAILKIKNNPQKLLFTLLIFNTLIYVGILFSYTQISQVLISVFHYSQSVKITTDLIILTFLIVIFGELVPKFYARRNAFAYSCKFIGFINTISFILSPVTLLFIKASKIPNKFIKNDNLIGVDNLTKALEIASEDKNTSIAEQKILEGIVNFGTIETRQVMTPRVDVFSLQKDLKFTEVVEQVSQNGYSRIPVYNKDIDDIIGILYAKDLIQYLNTENLEWNNLLKKPYFIPENKKIDDLLSDFKNRKMHLAVVVDEYGGTSGIVSLEDVIEEIVGEINDEFDDESIVYSQIDLNIYVFEGKTSVIDFCKVMDIDEKIFDEVIGDADTLAGLVLEIAEEFPKKLQRIYFKNFIFQVESLDRKRLKQIKITRLDNLVKSDA